MNLQTPMYYNVEISGNTFHCKDKIKALGLRWDGERKVWKSSLVSEDHLKALKYIKGIYVSVITPKITSRSNYEVNIPEGKTPYQYQIEGALFALQNTHCLIADEMGLGKTIQALLVANTLDTFSKVLVICPASLQINWKREAAKWYPNSILHVVSYSLAHKVCDYKEKWDLLILDEAHMIKNPKTIRTKAVMKIAKRSSRVIALTGTPILNRPIELFPLLKMFNHPLSASWERFVRAFCNGHKTRFGWDVSGFSNTSGLSIELRDCMIRRTKNEVLSELPEKIRSLHLLEASDYLKDLVDRENRRVLNSSKSLQELQSQDIEGIENLAKIRMSIAMAKIGGITDKIFDLLEEKEKLVVFFHHKQPLFDVKAIIELKGIQCVQVTGDMKIEQRQEAVDLFQNGPARVIFLTFGAGAEGLTLTAADTIIMAECDWTPARMMQAEDRCHRIGQKNAVNILYVVVEGSVDARIAQMAQEKGEKISEIIRGDLMKGL